MSAEIDNPDELRPSLRHTRQVWTWKLVGHRVAGCAISSTLLLTLLPFSSYIVSVPFVRDEWGMSNTQAAVVFSAYLVGSALSAVVPAACYG